MAGSRIFNEKSFDGPVGQEWVKIFTSATIGEMRGKKIIIQWNGSKREIAFEEPLVYATGAEANRELLHSLKGMEEFEKTDIYEIGDYIFPRQVRDAIFEGYMLSRNIQGEKIEDR